MTAWSTEIRLKWLTINKLTEWIYLSNKVTTAENVELFLSLLEEIIMFGSSMSLISWKLKYHSSNHFNIEIWNIKMLRYNIMTFSFDSCLLI